MPPRAPKPAAHTRPLPTLETLAATLALAAVGCSRPLCVEHPPPADDSDGAGLSTSVRGVARDLRRLFACDVDGVTRVDPIAHVTGGAVPVALPNVPNVQPPDRPLGGGAVATVRPGEMAEVTAHSPPARRDQPPRAHAPRAPRPPRNR